MKKKLQFWSWNALSSSAKPCGINFQGLHFKIPSNKIYFYKKTKLQAKKLGLLVEKWLKNGYLFVPFCQNILFKAKKSFPKRSAAMICITMIQKPLSFTKEIVQMAILLTFAFRSNLASEGTVLPVKKT